jgi:hypothetical protein
MKTSKPVATSIFPWLRANLGKNCLAPLTGTDAKALAAAVQIIELYSYDRDESVLKAFGQVVGRMQPKCQEFAYHAIAHVMDWSDRSPIWFKSGLDPLSARLRCEFEPRSLSAA